jgi:hypothetical protein
MAEKKYTTSVGSLIKLLNEIKEKCGENTPVQVNILGHECTTGLTSVCLDNDMGNDQSIVYFETDMEENYFPATFEFYTQGKEL